MPAIYGFVCKSCDIGIESFRREFVMCPLCSARATRKFSFNTQAVMQSHWNVSVGAEVSDAGRYRELLRKRSDEASERLGMTVNYQPIDPTEKEALGVDDTGMDETYAERRATGQDTPKRTYFV